MKSGELKKRKEARQKAEKELEEAKEQGEQEAIDKQNRRLVKVQYVLIWHKMYLAVSARKT